MMATGAETAERLATWTEELTNARNDLDRLAALAAIAEITSRALEEQAVAARHWGYTWAEVGQALGITREAAQQRFGR